MFTWLLAMIALIAEVVLCGDREACQTNICRITTWAIPIKFGFNPNRAVSTIDKVATNLENHRMNLMAYRYCKL